MMRASALSVRSARRSEDRRSAGHERRESGGNHKLAHRRHKMNGEREISMIGPVDLAQKNASDFGVRSRDLFSLSPGVFTK